MKIEWIEIFQNTLTPIFKLIFDKFFLNKETNAGLRKGSRYEGKFSESIGL